MQGRSTLSKARPISEEEAMPFGQQKGKEESEGGSLAFEQGTT